MSTRNQIINALAGTTFMIAGTTFMMTAEGNALPVVELNDGDYWPADDAVEIDGEWHAKQDCVQTHYGSWALADNCKEVYACWHLPTSRYAESEWYSEAQLTAALVDDEVQFVPSRDAYYTDQFVVYGSEEGEYLHIEDAIEVDGDYYHNDSESIASDGHGTWFLRGSVDWVYCDGDYWPTDECHICGDDWVHGDRDECDDCGRSSSRINAYHSSPSPYLYRGSSGWLVGFEVEKTEVDGNTEEGDSIEELPLFSGWETDGSCGVEGITNAYDPIDPSTRYTFLQHLRASSEYVNEPTNEKCGGHINLSHSRLTNGELFDKFRKYAGIYYALYKGRLNNEYCCGNKSLRYSSDKYVTVKRKPFGIELRLVSRVPNDVVLARRFSLIAATCMCIDGNVGFYDALRIHKPTLLDAYSDDRKRVAEIFRLAKHFQKWLHTNESHPSIERYIG